MTRTELNGNSSCHKGDELDRGGRASKEADAVSQGVMRGLGQNWQFQYGEERDGRWFIFSKAESADMVIDEPWRVREERGWGWMQGPQEDWLGYGHMVIKSRAGCLGLSGEVLSCIWRFICLSSNWSHCSKPGCLGQYRKGWSLLCSIYCGQRTAGHPGGEGHRPLPGDLGVWGWAIYSFSRVVVPSSAGSGEKEAQAHLMKKHGTTQVVMICAFGEERGPSETWA